MVWFRSGPAGLFGLALAIGLAEGAGAFVFRKLIVGFTWLLTEQQDFGLSGHAGSPHLPWLGPWFVLVTPIIGGLVFGPLIYLFAREARGHGVPEVMLAVAENGGRDAGHLAAGRQWSPRWSLTTPHQGDCSIERCQELVRDGAGDPNLVAPILGVQEWELAAATATRFQSGRVFLIGDAAHRTTPGGAMGMNTAVQDAHNLAWKLASVLAGWAKPALLDIFQAERMPFGRRNVALSLAIWNDMTLAGRTVGAVLGFSYDSAAVLPDGTAPPELEDPIRDYVPTARPGARAPHKWLDLDGKRTSAIDLFKDQFVLVAPSLRWCSLAGTAAASTGVPLAAQLMADPGWAELYGLGIGGAALLRPDGHVAWRTTAEAPVDRSVLERSLRRILVGP